MLNPNETVAPCNEEGFEDCAVGFMQALIDFTVLWARAHKLDLTDPEGNDVVRALLAEVVENMPNAKEMKEVEAELRKLAVPTPEAEA